MRFPPLFFTLTLGLTPVWAQPAPDSTIAASPTSNFSGLLGAPVAVRSEKVSLEVLRQRGQVAQITLRDATGTSTATLAAIGDQHALLLSEKGEQLKPLAELRQLYAGEAATAQSAPSALWIENPLQVIPITSIGDNAEVVASFVLKNRGETPLDLAVASTSCGCTSATLDKSRLERGESTTLKATMHADSERLVRVTLRTNDANSPQAVVALQSKRTFAPFNLPAPVSLYGEKGEALSAQTGFDLPAGWKIARVSATPAWLNAKLLPSPPATAGANTSTVSVRLAVEAPASAPEGAFAGRVQLELTGAPLQSLSVPVGGFIFNDITASPRMVTLGQSASGLARRIVLVRGPKPFSILSVRGDTPELKASADPRVVAKAHAVELLIPVAGKVGDSFFRRATLELSDGRELAIDISGTVAAGTLPALAHNLVLGGAAPTFEGKDSSGRTVSLASFRGRRNVLLTFFPHCFTGGCESHLASLQNVAPALAASNTQVIAVSTDDAPSIEKFARGLNLGFPVLTDQNRKISLSYGAVQTATEAPSRMTVLIDKNGVVRFIDTDVNVQTHGAEMLAKIKELGLNSAP